MHLKCCAFPTISRRVKRKTDEINRDIKGILIGHQFHDIVLSAFFSTTFMLTFSTLAFQEITIVERFALCFSTALEGFRTFIALLTLPDYQAHRTYLSVALVTCFVATMFIARFTSNAATYFNGGIVLICGAVLARSRYKHNLRRNHDFS